MINKALKRQILSIYPNEDLKKSLNAGDFDFAESFINEIINGLSIELSIGDGPSGLFNGLYYAIESEDIALFHKILISCFCLSTFTAISAVLATHSAMANPERRHTLPYLEKSYFLALNIINRYDELKNIDEIAAFNGLLALKRKRYSKVRGLKAVFRMPIADDLTHLYSSLADYLEALIHSNELSPEDVTHTLLNEDYDSLMEKIKVLACLKEQYMELKKEQITEIEENAQRQIEAIEEIGFPRS